MESLGAAKPVVGIVNYGAGNVGNVARAMKKLGLRYAVLKDIKEMGELRPTLLLLPGVGAFRPAAECLALSGWAEFLTEWAALRKPLLGICLGMQLLCSRSDEDVPTPGLNLLKGDVRRISGNVKTPHMGWNVVQWDGCTPSALLEPDEEPERTFYFVHSYAVRESSHGIATTSVGEYAFCSAMRNENVLGFQFHPERSGPGGVAFLGRALGFLHDICKGAALC